MALIVTFMISLSFWVIGHDCRAGLKQTLLFPARLPTRLPRGLRTGSAREGWSDDAPRVIERLVGGMKPAHQNLDERIVEPVSRGG